MKKRYLLLIVFGLAVQVTAQACNSCGSVAAGGGIGLLSTYKNNFISASWQFSRFHSNSEYEISTLDNFHLFELSGNYYFTNKIRVQVFLPFKFNVRQEDNSVLSNGGISDARVIGSYSVLKNKLAGQSVSITFELGAGMKFPTGKYESDIHKHNLPENFNLGQGNFAYIFQPVFVMNFKEMGLFYSSNFTYSGKSNSGYRYGHQWLQQLTYFMEHSVSKKIKLFPNAGLKSEWISSDTYSSGYTVHGTGGAGLFGEFAISVRWNKIMAGASYSHPIITDYSDGEVNAKGRVLGLISYSFNNNK